MNGQVQDRKDDRHGNAAPVVYVITLDLKPGCAAEFLALLKPVLDAMQHEESFINAVLHRDDGNPDRFMLYETWADHDEVLAVQIHRDYRQAYWARLPELLARPRDIGMWRPLRGPSQDRSLLIGAAPAAPPLTAAG